MKFFNEFNQPVGAPVDHWLRLEYPTRKPMHGRFCTLEPLDPLRHATELYQANQSDTDSRAWTYLPYGPFPEFRSYMLWLEQQALGNDPIFFTIKDHRGCAVGLASYLRIDPVMGVIEVGHLKFSQSLQRTPAATEAMYLMMQRAFVQGYRRYEWKCNALNMPSRKAAERLGFQFEGIFRQACVVKGRNRDTAWYSVLDEEWPALNQAFQCWLAPDNFDANNGQRHTLRDIRNAKALS